MSPHNHRREQAAFLRIEAIKMDVAGRGIANLDKSIVRWIKTRREREIKDIISVARDGNTHGHLLYSYEMQARGRRPTGGKVERVDENDAHQNAKSPSADSRPAGRLIRTPRDAELAAEEWMRYFGFGDASVTPVGADEGIDVNSTKAVAQVKAYMVPVGRPDVQNLAGVAAAERKRGVFFALSGYTPQAIQWADKADIALFSFDLQGEPEAVNSVAHKLMP